MYSQANNESKTGNCRAARGATDFPCSSCAPLAEFRASQCSTYAAPHVAIGLTPRAISSVQGGAFDTQFYTRLDRYYEQYGKYCKRLATIGATRRHLRNAGKAMKQNNAPAAIEEMEKAAVAMDVNGSETAKRVADAVDNAARNMADAVDNVIQAKNATSNANKKVQTKIEESIEKLESGELAEAGKKMLDAANEMDVEAKKSNNAVAKTSAESLKKAANGMKQAAVELANEQRAAAQERVQLSKEERNTNGPTDGEKKRAIELEAEAVVNATIAEAVRNGNNATLGASDNTPSVAMQAPVSSAVRNNAAIVNATSASISDKLSMYGSRVQSRSHAIYAGARGVEAAQKIPSRHSVVQSTKTFAEKHRQSVASIYDDGTVGGQCGQRTAQHCGGAKAQKKAGSPVNWRYAQPASQFRSLVEQFGEPDWLVDQPGGQAVWLDRGIFSRVVLQDVMIPHGEDHFDYLTFAVTGIDIPLEGQDELNRFSESVWYDALTDTLYARCHFAGANVASLIVAIDLAHDDDMTLEEALEAYPDLVEQSKDPQRYAEMLEMLSADVRAARAAKNSSKAKNQKNAQPEQ